MREKATISPEVVPWSASEGESDPAGGTRSAAVEVFAKFRKLTITSTRRHFGLMSRQTGINGAMTAALWEIKRSPGLRICELSRAMAIHQSTASNLVDKLLKESLVARRSASGGDRRVVRFHLTPKGEELVKRAPPPSRVVLQDALTELTPEALRTLNDLLDLLIRQLEGTGQASSAPLQRKPMANAA